MTTNPEAGDARLHSIRPTRRWRPTGALHGVWLSFLLVGCGGDFASVSGNVTLDGQPLTGGPSVRVTVLFFPESGVGVPAAGLSDESGAYQIATGSRHGLKPGTYLVAISGAEVIPAKTETEMPGRRQLTPLRYADPKQSGFRVDVKQGSNEFDFDLHSDS